MSDKQDKIFQYKTIHTVRKTRYSKIKQDIYEKWLIIIPLSTYYLPYLEKNTNVTQSVGYFSFENKKDAENYKEKISKSIFKLIIHLTRYGNFNNVKVLKHLKFDEEIKLNLEEKEEIKSLCKLIKY